MPDEQFLVERPNSQTCGSVVSDSGIPAPSAVWAGIFEKAVGRETVPPVSIRVFGQRVMDRELLSVRYFLRSGACPGNDCFGWIRYGLL